jgi:hypothetical protein
MMTKLEELEVGSLFGVNNLVMRILAIHKTHVTVEMWCSSDNTLYYLPRNLEVEYL